MRLLHHRLLTPKGGPEKHKANTADYVWLKGTSHAVRLDGKGDNGYHWSQCAVGKPRASTLDDIRTDLALVKAVDPEAAISGPEEEDREDISPADDPEAAISGPKEEDRDISPASTRRPPSAGRGRTIRAHLSSRQPRSRRQRAGGTKIPANQDGTENSTSR